jgi:hypothetical protein
MLLIIACLQSLKIEFLQNLKIVLGLRSYFTWLSLNWLSFALGHYPVPDDWPCWSRLCWVCPDSFDLQLQKMALNKFHFFPISRWQSLRTSDDHWIKTAQSQMSDMENEEMTEDCFRQASSFVVNITLTECLL